MLKFRTFLIFGLWVLGNQALHAQSPVLVAPADVVVSKGFSFDFSNLLDRTDTLFGVLHDDQNNRANLATRDLVCIAYCLPNPYTKYPGLDTNFLSTAPSIACDWFSQLYDITNPDDVYTLSWGLDGYYEALDSDSIKIRISDQRVNGRGPILRIFEGFDSTGLVVSDIQTIWVVDCECVYDPEFDCKDVEVNLYLNPDCTLTILPEWLLDFSALKPCNEYLNLELRDWITNQKIDRQVNLDGAQVDYRDKGRTIKFILTDPFSGNQCFGKMILLDTVAPILHCPADTIVSCSVETRPYKLGMAIVDENCTDYILNFSDQVVRGGCIEGYDRIINRKWIAMDNSGNKNECQHQIKVTLLSISDIILPPNFDGTDRDALNCQDAFDKSIDINSHMFNSPFCIDGFLLDSAFWKAHPLEPNTYPERRLPKVFGWNQIVGSLNPNVGHPNPNSIYYPSHKDWSISNPVCWGIDQHILWEGTGLPSGNICADLNISYRDSIVDRTTPNCSVATSSCYEIYREWTILDWCTMEVLLYTQKINITDKQAPEILYPDTIKVFLDPSTCKGRWEVLVPWLTDNCSNEIHYVFSSSAGDISGNETTGFVLSNLPKGIYTGTIIASDCCGNISNKETVILVEDNTPPNAVCVEKLKVTVSINQVPGKNVAKVFAHWMNKSSSEQCDSTIYFRIIRLDQLQGTSNGSDDSLDVTNNYCVLVNGDDNDNLDGTQIYFDEFATFCCADVDHKVPIVLRVFDRDPGAGPILPSDMAPGGRLHNHFSDCISLVEVVDNSVPTLVSPPDIVVSCSFPIDISKLSNPNDSTFGRIVSDLSLRNKVISYDKVCPNFCVKNDITGYPGPVNGPPPSSPPATNRACDYSNSLYDTIHPDRFYELVWGFDGYVIGSCEIIPEIQVTDFRKGGQGKITRRILAYGPNGVTVTATQTIWVVDCQPFFINKNNACDSLDDVIWPGNCDGQAILLANCRDDWSPANPLLGSPILINDRNCNLITVDYVDTLISNSPDACLKLIRTWTVIDWNQYEPTLALLDAKWTYQQIIHINDADVPDLLTVIATPQTADSSGFASIDLSASGVDNCTLASELQFSYLLDEFNDGSGKYPGGYDYQVGSLSLQEFNDGKVPALADNPRAFNANNPFNASGKYPVGTHKIIWTVVDGCGNTFSSEKLFEIKEIVGIDNDSKVSNELSIVPNPSNGNFKIVSNQSIDLIKLISSTGKTSFDYPVTESNLINLKGIPSGVYFVKTFKQGKQLAIAKLMVME
ncbi:MAG: T9SS type A sorting domain-containing protein [Saprospiraceae bacterium]|jgi:hypothetical protein